MNTPFYLLAQTASDAAANVTESTGFLSGFDEDHRFVLTIIIIGCVTVGTIALTGVAAGVWSSVRQKQIEADLKQDMLDRGMTADEIEQVVSARPKEGLDHWMEVWAKKKKC